MRFALWLIGLFAVATALALFAGSDPGTVTVYWPPYRIDLSLNLTLGLLLLAFLLLYLALRAISKLFALPRRAEQWRLQHRARAQHAALLDAWGHLSAGQPARAVRAAQALLTQLDAAPVPPRHAAEAAEAEEAAWQRARLRTVAHWLLAQGAHLRGDRPARDRQLDAALTEAQAGGPGGWRDAALLQAAEWAVAGPMSSGDVDPQSPQSQGSATVPARVDAPLAQAAGDWLDRLSSAAARRIGTRRLRLRAAVAGGATLDALRQARQLARHNLLTDGLDSHCRLACAHLQAAGNDPAALRRAWKELDATERTWPAVAATAARGLCRLGDDGVTARQWLLPAWQQVAQSGDATSAVDRSLLLRELLRTLSAGASDASPQLGADWRVALATRSRSMNGSLPMPDASSPGISATPAAVVLALDQPDGTLALSLLDDPRRQPMDAESERLAWRALAHRLAQADSDPVGVQRAWRRAAGAV